MALDALIEFGECPNSEVQGARHFTSPVAGAGADIAGDHEHQFLRAVLRGQHQNLRHRSHGIGRAEGSVTLTLEDGPAAFAGTSEVAALIAAGSAEVFGVLPALAAYEPQAQALEVRGRQPLEGQSMRRAGERGVVGHLIERNPILSEVHSDL